VAPARLAVPIVVCACVPGAAPPATGEHHVRGGSKQSIMPSGSRILVIEDDPDILDLVIMALGEAREPYEIQGVRGGGVALDLLRVWPADLVVLDLHIVDMSGERFLAACRREGLVRFRVLLLSGVADLASQAARLDVDGALAKPFEIDALLAAVRAALGD
jgi:DNA-binding response OmpR family regulator